MPFSMEAGLVPMIHKIVLDVPLGSADVPPPVGDYVEYGASLHSVYNVAGFGDCEDDDKIATYAELHLGYAAAAGASYRSHHGEGTTYFDPPLPYPFDEIYLLCMTVNCAGVQWAGCQIYYTLEKMTAVEILAAREELR